MNISFKKNRIIAVILAMFIIASSVLGFFGKIDSYAEDVSIVLAIWPTDVQVGDAVTATVTITGESLGEFDIFLEFPDDILQYTDGDSSGTIEIMGSETKTLTYNFKAIANGEGKIQTSGYKIYDVNGTQLSVVHAGGNIMVGETASTEDTIKIGNDTYTLVNDRRLPTPPEGYTISSVTYNDKEIYAYQSPTQNIKVVCLQNDEWEQKWFIYDEKKKAWIIHVMYVGNPFDSVLRSYASTVIVRLKHIPEGIIIDGKKYFFQKNNDEGVTTTKRTCSPTQFAKKLCLDLDEAHNCLFDSLSRFENKTNIFNSKDEVELLHHEALSLQKRIDILRIRLSNKL